MTAVVLRGDARALPLPDASVDLIVTSPPYYKQRDYRDGAVSLAGQIGSEATPREYVEALLDCTREWCRVLKPGGSLFVNLGDKQSTYTGAKWGQGRNINGGQRGPTKVQGGGPFRAPDIYGIPNKSLMGLPWRYALGCVGAGSALDNPGVIKLLLRDVGLGIITIAQAEQMVDDLAAMPADGPGLILRAEIIWNKPNALPESVTDRVCRAHEQVFHFVKQRRYYSALDLVREPHTMRPQRRPNGHKTRQPPGAMPAQLHSTSQRDEMGVDGHPLGKIPRSVWEIGLQALKVPAEVAHAECCGGRKRPGCKDGLEHYASFPLDLPRRIIKGWSPPGICTKCGEGRRPVSDRRVGAVTGLACACTPYTDHPERRGPDFHAGTVRSVQGMNDGNGGERYQRYLAELADPRGPVREYHFGSWAPAPTTPAVVVDPFGGTGSTALVAAALGRTGITIDRSAGYCRLATWRTTDRGERARALQVPKPAAEPDGQGDMFQDSLFLPEELPA